MQKPIKAPPGTRGRKPKRAPKEPRRAPKEKPVTLRSLRWVEAVRRFGKTIGFRGRNPRKPPVNGAKECARRRRQMGTGEFRP